MRAVHRRRISLLCAAITGVFATAVHAAPLADRIPADALMYFGWAGSQSLGPTYNASHLKVVVDASAVSQVFTHSLPALIANVARQDPHTAERLSELLAVGGPMWRHPSAMYVGPIDMAASPPAAHLALLCDAGNDGDVLLANLSQLIADAPPDASPLVVKKFGTLVVLSLGQPESWVTATFNLPPGNPLSTAPAFTAALGQVDAEAPSVAYVDVPAVVKQVDDIVPMSNNPKAMENWPKIRDALNLDGLKPSAATFGFDKADWSSQVFIGTAESASGVGAALASPALSADLLKLVPQSAVRMSAGHFNLSHAFGLAHSLVQQFDPDSGEKFDETLARVNAMAGLDVQHDLLDSLGDEWLSYADGAVAGSGSFGFVLVNKLNNPQHAATALDELAQRANTLMDRATQKSAVTFKIRQMTSNGVTIHFLSVPFVSPAWTISGDKLYLGLYPQAVDAAVRFAASGKASILQNVKFLALQKRFGAHPMSSVSYLDLPTLAPQGYSDVLAISQLYLGGLDLAGGDLPAMVMPPLDKLLPDLTSSSSAAWSDAAGYHSRSVSPFPGSDALGTSAGASSVIGESALMTSVLLPSLNRARETANRVKCASNERQIGQAILMYSNENRGKYPDHLGELIEKEDITPQVFICPSATATVPPAVANMSVQDKATWVEEHGDYIYLGKGMNNSAAPDVIVLYEKLDDHNKDGINMLFGDGHVEFQNLNQAKDMLQKQGAPPLP